MTQAQPQQAKTKFPFKVEKTIFKHINQAKTTEVTVYIGHYYDGKFKGTRWMGWSKFTNTANWKERKGFMVPLDVGIAMCKAGIGAK